MLRSSSSLAIAALAALAALAAGILTAGVALAQDNARYVAVDGEASISVTPNVATLTMAIAARNADVDTARDEVVRVTRRVLDFVSENDVDEDDVQTTGLSIRPDYRWNDRENRQELLGYVVQRNIVVRLGDLARLGDIMEGVVDAGVNQVQPPQLGHTDEGMLRRRALAAATRDARANAQQIAATLDVGLGPVRNVVASQTTMPQPPYARAMMSEAAADGADTYSTGQIEFEARVTAEFDLITAQ